MGVSTLASAPDGLPHPTLTLAFVVRGAAAALDFYARAFGAREILRIPTPAGTVAHAQMRVGDSLLFLSDEVPGVIDSYQAPEGLQGTTFVGYLFVPDADALFTQAVVAGATAILPVKDQPWGNREGLVRDPFGHLWAVASRKPR
jgi:PhnB protein